ncbi:COPII coat Sec23p-Sfb3p heterodimer component [Batrachochytrium dendrobatidis]|nr:COPII coat Sec23p-Sfb3p heterodimer component [Batrachochytrium dendrobatidis]
MNQAGHPSAALQQPMANHHAQGPPPQSPASTHSSIPGPATNMPTRPNYPPNSPASRQQQWRPAASNGRPPNMSGMPMNPQQQGPQQHLQGMSGNRSAQGSPSRPPQQIQQSQSTPQVRPLYGQSAQGQQPRPAFTSPTPAGPLMNNAMSTHMGQSQTSMQNGQRPMMSTPSMPQPYRPPQQATSPADLSAGQQPSPGVDELNQQFGSMGVASRASRSKRVYPGMQQSSPLQDQFPATQSQPGFPSNQQPGMASPQQFQQQPGMVPPQQFQQQPGMVPPQQFQQQPGMVPPQQFQQQPGMVPPQQFQQQPGAIPPQQFQQQPGAIPPQQFQQQPGMFQQQPPATNFQQNFTPGQPPIPQQPMSSMQLPQQKHRINPDQIPSPVALHEADQNQYMSTPYMTMSRTVPPLAASKFTVFDNGNCSPRFIRSTIYNIPITEDLISTSKLPFGVIVQPLADLEPTDTPVPLVDFGINGPVRCSRCKGYINPFFQFVHGGRKFVCNLCSFESEVPTQYFENLDMSGRRIDISQRPELLYGSCEFTVTPEYCARPTKSVSYFFAIDVSYNAVRSGMLAACASALKQFLYSSQRPMPNGSTVGFITFDKAVHFYSLKPNLEQFQMMIVGDIDEMFVPLSEGLLVDPIESKTVIINFLDSLPQIFANTTITEPVLGAACQAAFSALKQYGGKLSIFQTALPTFGPGALKNREDVKILGTDKERQLYESQEYFWKKLAQDCTTNGIGVDTYLFPNAYIDVATVGMLSAVTSGDTYLYMNFDANKDGEKFINDMQRALFRSYGFDALLRVRVSDGLKVTDYYGNFYMKNSTDIELAGIDSLKAFGVVLKHDGKLDEKQDAHIQAALLYTTSDGQRRVRVHNLSLPTTSQLTNVFRFAEMDTSVNFFAREAIQNAFNSPLKTLRDQISARCVKILASYRSNISTQSSPGQLILPESYKLYPLYALSLLKSRALRGGKIIPSDLRVSSMRLLNSIGVTESVAYMYPNMYDFTEPATNVGQLNESGIMVLPPIVRVSFERMNTQGFYIIENGRHMFLWIGREAPSHKLQALFGVDAIQQVDATSRRIPQVNTTPSQQLNTVLEFLRQRRARYMQLTIVRHGMDPISEARMSNLLIEDANLDNLSYVDYLVLTHKNVQGETAHGK